MNEYKAMKEALIGLSDKARICRMCRTKCTKEKIMTFKKNPKANSCKDFTYPRADHNSKRIDPFFE